MATVHDVAAYILRTQGAMTAMKLEKLVYYCQAWYLVWEEAPLFTEDIEAWANGPVCPELYRQHRGQFIVNSVDKGNPDHLTDVQREDIDLVLNHYGDMKAWELSELTHREDPWHLARTGLHPGDRSSAPITIEAMAEYYSSLI